MYENGKEGYLDEVGLDQNIGEMREERYDTIRYVNSCYLKLGQKFYGAEGLRGRNVLEKKSVFEFFFPVHEDNEEEKATKH